MNLEEYDSFLQFDPQRMIAQINGLPEQLWSAWELGQQQAALPFNTPHCVVIAGMGGSAIGADLLAAYAAPVSATPVMVLRTYDLPAWVQGPQHLVICSSHSGNTEETLSVYAQARQRGCSLLSVTTGGELAARSAADGAVLWQFEHTGQPRAAVGYSFGLLLAALVRLGLLPDPTSALQETLHAMRNQQTNFMAEVPVMLNAAKRMAGQLVGRNVVIFAADHLEPVARRWKGQLNELAKTWAHFEFLPEADHNTLAGINHPEQLLPGSIALFLQASSNHARNRLRLDLTRKLFLTQGINTDFINARGHGPLAHIWTLLHYGDYVAYYLAMAYAEDPTPVDALVALKEELSVSSQ